MATGSNDYDDYTCHMIGINGGCGLDCPVLLRGDCETEDEMYGREIAVTITIENEDLKNFDRAMEILK